MVMAIKFKCNVVQIRECMTPRKGWTARKHHDKDRVRTYTNPAVHEVIYPDEWNNQHKSNIRTNRAVSTSGKVTEEEWKAYRTKLNARDRINVLTSPWFYLIIAVCVWIIYNLLL